jgi:hypothetical protein
MSPRATSKLWWWIISKALDLKWPIREADIGWPAGGKVIGSVRHPLGTADFASICCDISATTANIRHFFRIKARRTTCILHNASGKV